MLQHRVLIAFDGDNCFDDMVRHNMNLERLCNFLLAGGVKVGFTFFLTLLSNYRCMFAQILDRSGFQVRTYQPKIDERYSGKLEGYSDMQILVYLLNRTDDFDQLFLVTADTDFALPITLLRERYGKKVDVAFFGDTHESAKLRQAADNFLDLSDPILASMISQAEPRSSAFDFITQPR
jgi:hypothetical protein